MLIIMNSLFEGDSADY